MPTASPGAVAGTGKLPWPRPATMPMIFAEDGPYGFPTDSPVDWWTKK
jgi:hypothetical protein